MPTILTPTNDTTDRRAAYETAVTTGDRTVIFDGTSGDGTFWMTGRDVGVNNGLTGCKGATIVFKGAPIISALPTTGTDRGLFAFQATNDATTAGMGVSMFTDTKSNSSDDWATLEGNLEVESVVLFDGQSAANRKFNCVGGRVSRVVGQNGIKHGFNFRPGGILQNWVYSSTSSDSGADAVHTLAGVRSPYFYLLDGTLGAMPNASSGRQIKISQIQNTVIRNVRYSADAYDSTNQWTLNLGADNGTVIIQNCDLPGGITHTAGNGVVSCETLLIEDTRLGEGTASPVMGRDRLHNDIAVTNLIYRRVNFDGIDRFCFQPRSGYPELVPTLTSENCTYRAYNNVGSTGVRPMLTFNLTATTFRVRGTNTLTGVAPNGLISSSNSTIANAWTAGTDTGFVKRDMDLYLLGA